jgi:L-lactate dehydrogenase complex protein LldF
MATQPAAWKLAMFGGKIMNVLPAKYIPVPALQAWQAKRTLPAWRGGAFRSWLRTRAQPAADVRSAKSEG